MYFYDLQKTNDMIIPGKQDSNFKSLYIISIACNIIWHTFLKIISNDVDNLRFHSTLPIALQHIHDLHCYESSDDL